MSTKTQNFVCTSLVCKTVCYVVGYVMARSAVHFSDVRRARNEVIAPGRHPSIDAVRAAFGNTGAKTTTYKYLREIEVEEGGATQAVSDAILALTTQLAEQLKWEATAELDEVRARMDEQRAADERARAQLDTQLGEARRAVDDVSRRLEARSRTLRPSKTSLAPRRSRGIPRSSACWI